LSGILHRYLADVNYSGGKECFQPRSKTKFLEVIRAQRHDFINHLQVISGYLQLDKKETALSYIEQLSKELVKEGRINRVALPEARAAFIFAAHDARDVQVEFNYQVEATLANTVIPAETAAAVLEEIFAAVLAIFKAPNDDCFNATKPDKNRRVEVILREAPGKYLVLINLCRPESGVLEKIKQRLDAAEKKYAGSGINISTSVTDRLELMIIFPFK